MVNPADVGVPNFLRRLNKAIDLCILALAYIGSAIVLFLLLAVCFATLSRYLLNKPFAFLIDYSSYSLLFIAFLGAPWLLQQNGHVSIDMLVEKLPLRFKRFWRAGISLIIALISATVCYVGILIVQSSYANWTVIDDFLRTPKWIILSPIPISAFFLAIQAFRDMAGELAATKSETKEETA